MRYRGGRGFTLIELIVTLVIVAILGVMAAAFFGSGVTRPDVPLTQLQTDASLQQAMENMISDFKENYSQQSNLLKLQEKIGASGSTATLYNSNSSYYIKNNTCYYLDTTTSTFETETSATKCDYLFVTITPAANSGMGLSYLFASKLNN